jgi:hypothetical protein
MLEGRRFFLVPHRALPDLQRMKLLLFCGRLVGLGEFLVRSVSDEAIHAFFPPFRGEMHCFAQPVIGAHSRDPLARNDDGAAVIALA